MPVELRKRKAPQPPPAPAPAAKKAGKVAKPAAVKPTPKAAAKPASKPAPKTAANKTARAARKAAPAPSADEGDDDDEKDEKKDDDEPSKEEAAPAPAPAAKTADKNKSDKPVVGDVVDLADFGGVIETNSGKQTTLKELVDESKAGVVLFTYPKASTPGCTTQACLFRDAYEPLTADWLSIFGLSTDSPKANTTFKEKQKLPFPLLCDPQATLIAAIGLKKQPKGTTRGVFVVDKNCKVLVAEAGGPAATVDRVKALVEEL